MTSTTGENEAAGIRPARPAVWPKRADGAFDAPEAVQSVVLLLPIAVAVALASRAFRLSYTLTLVLVGLFAGVLHLVPRAHLDPAMVSANSLLFLLLGFQIGTTGSTGALHGSSRAISAALLTPALAVCRLLPLAAGEPASVHHALRSARRGVRRAGAQFAGRNATA